MQVRDGQVREENNKQHQQSELPGYHQREIKNEKKHSFPSQNHTEALKLSHNKKPLPKETKTQGTDHKNTDTSCDTPYSDAGTMTDSEGSSDSDNGGDGVVGSVDSYVPGCAGGGEVHLAEAVVVIEVRDINDNAPVFPLHTTYGQVLENGPTGE